MDWSNERYVRVYTRDTATWKLLDWRARTVLLHLFRKVDRAGVLDVGEDGVEGLAAVLELPLEIVEPGIAALTKAPRSLDRVPTVVHTGSAYLLPNFMEAQEAKQSEPQRQRESRAKRRERALFESRFVTAANRPLALPPGDDPIEGIEDLGSPTGNESPPSRNVTPAAAFRSQPSHAVTARHSEPDPDPSLPEIHTPARAHAIPPTPKPSTVPAPTPVLSSTWQKQKRWNDALLAAFDRLIAKGIKPNTPRPSRNPHEITLHACERYLREAGYDDTGINEKMLHVIAVNELEAERLQHLDYFKPAIIWDLDRPDRFRRKLDTSLEEARRGPQRAPAKSAHDTRDVRVVRDEEDRPPPIPKWHRGGS
jgi:hypothetical protein